MKISILGIGNWGCSIAHLLCKKGHEINLYGRNNEKVQHLRCKRNHPNNLTALDAELKISNNLESVISDTDLIIEAVTLSGLRSVISQVNRIQFDAPIIITSKGMEVKSNLFPSQIIEEIFGKDQKPPTLVFSGPTISKEITLDGFSSAVLACKDENLAKAFAKMFRSEKLEVSICKDIMGVQLGGAFKNIFAIGCGMLDGLGYGNNVRACLITKGLGEMCSLAIKLRYMPQTLYGLSGLGDLIATCLSSHSRNFQLGQCIGQRISLKDSLKKVGAVVEGIGTGEEILNLARKNKVWLPISHAIFAALDQGVDKSQFINCLRNCDEF